MGAHYRAELASRAVDPHAEVEKMYIAEYLKGKGYTLEDVASLPETVARALLEEASLYASLRLAELETGAALFDKLHFDDTMPTRHGTHTPRVVQTSPERE
jgi:hypothetical protein